MRVDNIDIVAALDRTTNLRGLVAGNDIEVVVRLLALVKAYRLSLIDREVLPIDDIVLDLARDIRHNSRLLDVRPRRLDVVEHGGTLCHGDDAERSHRQHHQDVSRQPLLAFVSHIPILS